MRDARDVKINDRCLWDILVDHKMYLDKYGDNWEQKRAVLCDADLSEVDLSGANLCRAIIINSDLSGANLSNSNLRDANLSGITAKCTNFTNADLRRAGMTNGNYEFSNFQNAILVNANLTRSYFHGASFMMASLISISAYHACFVQACFQGACLTEANLSYSILHNAVFVDSKLEATKFDKTYLSGATFEKVRIYHTSFKETNELNELSNTSDAIKDVISKEVPSACPEEGSFIGWKKTHFNGETYIVKLKIPESAHRSSGTGRMCRCDKAKVLEIQNLDGSKAKIKVVRSFYDHDFTYELGKTIEVPYFSKNRFDECSPGIHFFISRQEAVNF